MLWIIIINNALNELVNISSFQERKLNINIKENTNTLTITFADNAGGIKNEIKEKLFDPFISTKKSSGLGIGLSIAKKIVKEHNGEIKAYNQNNGAVFEVTLPKIQEEKTIEL